MASSLTIPDTLPATSSGSATGNPRNKVALKQGHGLLDWVRLGHTVVDLAGTGGNLLKVTVGELAKHSSRNDAWIALKGKVYNVTPYFDFHPGGEDELMRGAGKDATQLFNEVHKWVNFTSVLQKCLVGNLIEQPSFFLKPSFLPLKRLGKVAENYFTSLNGSSLPLKLSATEDKIPSVLAATPILLPSPKYDWFQTKMLINVAIYTKWKDITRSHVIVINSDESFKVVVYIQNHVFTVHVELYKKVERDFVLKIGSGCGKVDILLKKSEQGVRWPTLGRALSDNNHFISHINKEVEYITCTVSEKLKVNRNCYLFKIKLPDYVHMVVPIGHHVFLRVPKSDVTKPYTPVITPFQVQNNENEINVQDKFIQFFIKIYPEGHMTPQLEELHEGEEVEASYHEGTFSTEDLQEAALHASYLVLLAAGTGITPMIKLMLEALRNEVKTLLIMFNRTEEDIPWKIELDSLVVTHSKLFRVTHVLSNASESWKGRTGRVRRELLDEILPISDGEMPLYLCVCGTTGFTNLTVSLLQELGYLQENIFAFTG